MIEIKDLNFSYPESALIFRQLSLSIPLSSRVLCIGANGTGKSTLLRLLAGHHILPRENILIQGHSPFYDQALSHQMAFVDFDFPLQVDLTVQEVLDHGRKARHSKLESKLCEILKIDRTWHMHHVSEGQKRRVQLLLALRQPKNLLLLDEVTAHLDLGVREDFLIWLKNESEKNGLTIFYATHILDGLQALKWPTHLLLFSFHSSPVLIQAEDLADQPLYQYCSEWIRKKSKR